MDALDVNSIVPDGSREADEWESPSSVIVRMDLLTVRFPEISDGVNQLIAPFQYSVLRESGVPPPTIVTTSSSLRCCQVKIENVIGCFSYA